MEVDACPCFQVHGRLWVPSDSHPSLSRHNSILSPRTTNPMIRVWLVRRNLIIVMIGIISSCSLISMWERDRQEGRRVRVLRIRAGIHGDVECHTGGSIL